MVRVYATASEYEAWTQETSPGNVDALLRAASRIVDELLVGVVYDTDTAGMPTDPDVVQAMSDATCAVAASPVLQRAVSGGSASSGEWSSLSVGNVSLTRADGDTPAGDAPTVGGVPVPLLAVQALQTVGPRQVMIR